MAHTDIHHRPFERIAIVDRGAAALRLIRAVRELNHEQRISLSTVTLFTEPDRRALFVREADDAICIGPALFIDQRDQRQKSSYHDSGRIEQALVKARADAAWVGWGLLAEEPWFADLCSRLGMVFIGPDTRMLRLLGNKISAKHLAQQAGVPVIPWSGGAIETAAAAQQHAGQLGYPLMVKPARSTYGQGIHRVSSPPELASAWERAHDQAFERSSENPDVFLEQMVEGVRQVEVQVIADNYGTTWVLGVCDCTVQYHSQKLLQESGPLVLPAPQKREICEAALRLCRAAGYRNAGTVEFLYSLKQGTFWFLEFNPRLSAEHAVTEITTGLDLVKLQLEITRGTPLEGDPPASTGHAVEVHLSGRDAERVFAPGPGVLDLFRLAGGPGLRIDNGFDEGDVVPAEFDPLLANVIAWGRNRQEARARLSRALSESAVLIRGGTSNRSSLLALLNRRELDSDEIDTLWLDRLAIGEAHSLQPYADVALLQAALEAYTAEQLIEQAHFFASAARGRPRVRQEVGLSTDFQYRGQAYRFHVSRLGTHQYRVVTDGQRIDVHRERLGSFACKVTCFGRRYRILSVVHGPNYDVEVEGIMHRMIHEDGGIVRAPAPTVVVSVSVASGDLVAVGDRLAVVETMKMEMSITAPYSGRVRHVFVTSNIQVDAGAPLVQLEPLTREEPSFGTERVRFGDGGRAIAPTEESPQHRCRQVLADVRCLMLGFDFDTSDARRLLAEQSAVYQIIAPDDPELLHRENELLATFADVCSLFRREMNPAEAEAHGELVHSAEWDMNTYLRFRDTRVEQLPSTFLNTLRRALAHYGVHSLDPSPRLDESLLAIYRSHQRVNQHVTAMIALLERRLTQREKLAAFAPEELRTLLDRLQLATREQYPAVSDLAHEVRFYSFDRPLIERARNDVYQQMQAHLAYLAQHPDAADRDERIAILVACPYPLQKVLTGQFPLSGDGTRQIMLEVLTRRYYRIRQLEHFTCMTVDGQAFALAAYTHEGVRISVATTFSAYPNLGSAAETLARVVAQLPAEHDIVVDFYTWRSGSLGEAETMEQEVRAAIEQAGFRRLRRIVIAVIASDHGPGMASTIHYTYRPHGNGYQEERLYRGLHPMMGKRLHLGRFAHFTIERLPSAEDVYLFHGIARDNPKDQRLFALTEVRDTTPLRDESNKVMQIPQLEHMVLLALDGMRLYQSRLPTHKRLLWNRLLLYVWSPLAMPAEEFLEVMRKLWPATEGLGLERIVVHAKIPQAEPSEMRDHMLHFSNPGGRELVLRVSLPMETPIATLSAYRQKVVQLRQRGLVYPYELLEMLTPTTEGIHTQIPSGDFTEYDLDETNQLVPVDRPYGKNRAGIVVGVIRNYPPKYPEGMTRVILLGDPSRNLGSVAEPECRRVNEAIHLATRLQVPIEWFTLSSGARISMDSGTENMDWVGRTLRCLIEFTQAGGEVNVIVNGINVGAQPYWNAEATMLMHTHGILIMTPHGAMVLTGKQSLDYSGGVSAEDNYGIGGYERVMGPNGQAQYFAPDLAAACQLLMQHYEHTYILPGERFPRRASTSDPLTRDVRDFPYTSTRPEERDLTCVGDLFSAEKNADRKRAFDIRSVMTAFIDADHSPLERWQDMRNADTVVVWDAHIGGYPVAMLGIESRPLPRRGFVPGDGPEQWTAGTLFPQSAKKTARAINSASGNRPLLVVANLSGFDGSPESLRTLELEYGAEVGRAITNFKGPIVICVISRYHGGAFVVFSKVLNENIEVAAVEGSYASVIGGVPAAAVVFAREVDMRTQADPRIQALQVQIAQAIGSQKATLQVRVNEVTMTVHSEKVGEVASEFDHIHSVQRAQRVGSIDHVIAPAALRPYLIKALERGIKRSAAQ